MPTAARCPWVEQLQQDAFCSWAQGDGTELLWNGWKPTVTIQGTEGLFIDDGTTPTGLAERDGCLGHRCMGPTSLKWHQGQPHALLALIRSRIRPGGTAEQRNA